MLDNMPEQTTSASSSIPSPLESYGNFPFSTDEAYQQGLASLIAGGILQNNPTPREKDEILRRTRVFYFNSATGNKLSMDEAREYERSLSLKDGEETPNEGTASDVPNTSTDDSSQPESRVLTFAELQELIESGRQDQIPNNRIIPDQLNDAPPSQSTTPVRKKPWELSAMDETGVNS